MNSPISKTPFLFLLIPLVFGILVQYYGCNIVWSIIVACLGSSIILFSYLNPKGSTYSLRWLFGSGVVLFFIGLGGVSTYVKQQSLDYVLVDSTQTYIGYVTETPQTKPRSVAYKVQLTTENVNVVCYLAKDSAVASLGVGDELIFISRLQAFKNAGNPNEFEYDKYMYNQGFVASAYLSSSSWIRTGKTHHSLKIFALKIREEIMLFYESIGFQGDNLAVLSALTLGYQDTLSDDLKQGFRSTGTVHILSVSGLHVGIIFSIISLLLSFIRRGSRFYPIRPLLIILLLWCYAFITGLPPSVIRASTMLTMFCLADLLGQRKHNSLNSLFVAALVMLLYNPFWLFDIGFQLSFISVLSILVLHRRMVKLIACPNRVIAFVWNLLCLSLVAQLATFPLCLYYFGTFPTYFFIANLIIVPLVSLITYAVGLVVVALVIGLALPMYIEPILRVPVYILKFLVEIMNRGVKLIENLPFALLENIEITGTQLVILFAIIVCILYAGIRYNSRSLISALGLTVVFVGTILIGRLQAENDRLIIYNRNGQSDIRIVKSGASYPLESFLEQNSNPVIQFGTKKVLIVNSSIDPKLYTDNNYEVDYAIVIGDVITSMSMLDQYYDVSNLVLDSSTKSYLRNQLAKECENRNILIYDVSKNGGFSIIF